MMCTYYIDIIDRFFYMVQVYISIITVSMPLGAQPDSAVGALMVVLRQGLHAEWDKAAAATSPAKKDFQ